MADFANPITASSMSLGSGVRYKSVDNAIVNTASTTDTSITPSPGIKVGRARVRTKSVDASATTQIKVTVSDGTTTFTLEPTTNATAAGEGIDWVIPFHLDIAVTQLTVVFTLGGATKSLTYDLELVGTN